MKKIMMMALVAMITLSATAQNRPSREEMQARRAEQIEKQADRLSKDFDLKGDAKTNFVATYKAYQDELASTMMQGRQRQTGRERGEQADSKKLTSEQAQKQLEEYFSRQEEQIAQQQKRLEIEKKYCTELSKTLTPQQLVKIFGQRQGQQQQRQGGIQRQGGFGGPQGGGRGGFGGGQGGFGGGADF